MDLFPEPLHVHVDGPGIPDVVVSPDMVQQLLPRLWEIMCEINRRWCDYLVQSFGWDERVGRNLIIRDGQVHMANLCLSACRMVNGVSRLHGEILRSDLFKDICSLRPERFTYVTNGIDHRRWLAQVNPGLHGLICELLGGDEYLTNADALSGLRAFETDPEVLHRINAIKRENRAKFTRFLAYNRSDIVINPDAMMDVQIKRLHEYKRQLLCAMSIASLQMKLHDNPNMDFVPRSFIFGAKAAAGYYVAKRIIELLLSMQRDINGDPVCKDRLQICFVENYRVSAAEAIVPLRDIKLKGIYLQTEMKNGVQPSKADVTIGTLDGANVEMYERLGDENMFLFGLHTDEIESWRHNGYDPASIANNDPEITRIMQRFSQGFSDGKSYSDLVSGLLYGGDPYMLIADYRAYAECRDRLYTRISDESERARLALVNTAESGFFAADRAVREYAERIWNL